MDAPIIPAPTTTTRRRLGSCLRLTIKLYPEIPCSYSRQGTTVRRLMTWPLVNHRRPAGKGPRLRPAELGLVNEDTPYTHPSKRLFWGVAGPAILGYMMRGTTTCRITSLSRTSFCHPSDTTHSTNTVCRRRFQNTYPWDVRCWLWTGALENY